MKITRTAILALMLLFSFLPSPIVAGMSALAPDATIASIQKAIEKRQINCAQVVQAHIDRIRKINLDAREGPPLNAIVAINPDIFEDARRLDARFKSSGKLTGLLHCIPILLKDNIDSIDTPSTSGSLALIGSQPERDAFLVTQLKNAGAIILGKSTMDELASGVWGVSTRSGRTGNAYDPSKSAGGSSSGSAVAVSTGMAVASIGSDNNGSLRIPAAYNGVFTIRPTPGLISDRGGFPRGRLDGVFGPITRSVTELAILLDVIAVFDPENPKTLNINRPSSYFGNLRKNGLAGKRIGILTRVHEKDQFREVSPGVKSIYDNTFVSLEKLGAVLIRDVKLPKFDIDRKNNMAGEIEEVNEYLSSFPSTRANYDDLCRSDRTQIAFEMNECFKHIRETASKGSQEYNASIRKFDKNRTYVEEVMDQNKLDAMIVPIDSRGVAGDGQTEGLNCIVASNSGLPSIGIIAGYTNGPIQMPVGMEIIGRRFSEPTLLEVAFAYEQKSGQRILPSLVRNVPVTSPLDSLTIRDLNRLFTNIGWVTYQEVLKVGKRESLTPEVFRKIISSVLEKQK